MLETGIEVLCNCRISPRHMELLSHVSICLGSYSMERYIEPTAKVVTYCITQ